MGDLFSQSMLYPLVIVQINIDWELDLMFWIFNRRPMFELRRLDQPTVTRPILSSLAVAVNRVNTFTWRRVIYSPLTNPITHWHLEELVNIVIQINVQYYCIKYFELWIITVDAEKVFVHEWSHLRYGVFDEFGQQGNDNFPLFYKPSPESVESIPNLCSNEPPIYTTK